MDDYTLTILSFVAVALYCGLGIPLAIGAAVCITQERGRRLDRTDYWILLGMILLFPIPLIWWIGRMFFRYFILPRK